RSGDEAGDRQPSHEYEVQGSVGLSDGATEMRTSLLLLALSLPLAAQPKKLVNAQLDTRPAASGLESAFRPLVASAQPAWIGYIVNAIGMHADAAADAALERFVAPDQPEAVRQKAVYWLGLTRSGRGFEVLKKIMAGDPSDRVRERAVQALSMSREPGAIDLV